ncbi:MAG TPA: YIP1 family protein, partial [Verrucomicrobiae bacterium]|nr:YIP1 family protein [Verrucomicrobiae bacterium]
EKYMGPTVLKISGSIGAVFVSFIRVFWWALILWLLGRWFLKAKFSYLKTVEVAGLATMISVLGAIVTMLLTVNFGKMTTPSLAMMFSNPDPKNKLQMLFAALDLFNLWFVVVAAVGLARLAGSRFSRAFLCVAVYWLVFLAVMSSLGSLAGGLSAAG